MASKSEAKLRDAAKHCAAGGQKLQTGAGSGAGIYGLDSRKLESSLLEARRLLLILPLHTVLLHYAVLQVIIFVLIIHFGAVFFNWKSALI